MGFKVASIYKLRAIFKTMRYNLIISTYLGTYNILLIDDAEIWKVVNSYNKGLPSFFIEGQKYNLYRINRIKVYSFTSTEFKSGIEFREFAEKRNMITRGYMNISSYIDDKILLQFGEDVTKDFIKNDYGADRSPEIVESNIDDYVNKDRITQLQELEIKNYDFSKLISFCLELNTANKNGMFLTIPMLIRAIIDHIPPLFNKTTFIDMCGSYGNRSFQEIMLRLEKSSRKIADSFLHLPIRNKEVLPNETQVNFKNELDVLLSEIIRVHK